MKRHILVSLSVNIPNARAGENLGIRYIKSYLNANGYTVDILEDQFLRLTPDLLSQKINEYDIIGFSINYCGQIPALRDILNRINSLNKVIYLGGHFATICYQSLLKEFSSVNFIMLADGELATLAFARCGYQYENIPNVAYLSCGRIIKNASCVVNDLDTLPFPFRDRNSFYMGDKHFSVISSRGCYNNCSYCSVGSFTCEFHNHMVRMRTATNIFEELKELKEQYDIQYVTFQDDLFVGKDRQSQNRAQALAEKMIQNNLNIFFSIQCSVNAVNVDTFSLLYRAGLRNAMIGIENFSDHALKCFSKRQSLLDIENAIYIIRSIGIPLSYGFIMYYPEMEPEEILENLERLHSFDLINLNSISSKLTIYLGTHYCEKKLNKIDVAQDDYSVKYTFKDERLQQIYNDSKLFAQSYRHIEQRLYRLEFLSHTNNQINHAQVRQLFRDFRDCIYLFSKNRYFEVFEDCSVSNQKDVFSRLDILESSISRAYLDADLMIF